MVLMEITWKVSHSSIPGCFVESLVATKPSSLSREAERKKSRVVRDLRDLWDNVHHIDVTELECTFKIATWQREAVDKQVHTQSLDSVGATYWLYFVWQV